MHKHFYFLSFPLPRETHSSGVISETVFLFPFLPTNTFFISCFDPSYIQIPHAISVSVFLFSFPPFYCEVADCCATNALFKMQGQNILQRNEQAQDGSNQETLNCPHIIIGYENKTILDDVASLIIHHMKRQTSMSGTLIKKLAFIFLRSTDNCCRDLIDWCYCSLHCRHFKNFKYLFWIIRKHYVELIDS